MSISRFVPPLDYLKAASRTSLQSFELARRNHASNLRREIAALIDQWIQEASEATLARWLLDHHESLHELPPSASEALSMLPDPSAILCPIPPDRCPTSFALHRISSIPNVRSGQQSHASIRNIGPLLVVDLCCLSENVDIDRRFRGDPTVVRMIMQVGRCLRRLPVCLESALIRLLAEPLRPSFAVSSVRRSDPVARNVLSK